MHPLFGRPLLAFLLVLSVAPVLLAQKVFLTYVVSPDGSNFTGFSGANDPAGRIKSLIVDPTDDKILYAASEFGGVWKSTTGVTWVSGANGHTTASDMKWVQASTGLRSGLTMNQTSLAIDKSHHEHLLYATGEDDGRPTQSLGGLWVSLDAAGTWIHQNPCPSSPISVVSVAFTDGQPYASTDCGVVTTSNPSLDGGWTVLPSGTNSPPNDSVLVDGGFGTLFACSGNQVYQATDAGASGNWNVLTVPGSCDHLAAVPNGGAASTQAIVIWNQTNAQGVNFQEVSVVDFGKGTSTALGYSSRPSRVPFVPGVTTSDNNGSGVPAVATAPISNPMGKPAGPGVTYDVYAADRCAWYAYNPGPSGSWTMLGANGNDCSANTTLIHADTWAMAFPSWYDPANSFCAAYAATDGGVFFSGGKLSAPLVGGCTNNWQRVQNGLHVLESSDIYAITEGSKTFTTSLTDGVYLSTGDNDVFVTTFGWTKWLNFSALGDAGYASVDAAFPNQVVIGRNGNFKAISNPPLTTTTPIELIPPETAPAQFDIGIGVGGASDFAQVMTTQAEFASPPKTGDYLTVLDQDGSCKSKFDWVVRSRVSLSSAGAWTDVSPKDHFNSCNIAKIQAAGGHADGFLNIYVLTGQANSGNYSNGRGPGQIYRGVVSKGQVAQWDSASGPSTSPLPLIDNFLVNPYNSAELYAVSIASGQIFVSTTSGTSWTVQPTLTDIATNHGEYRIGCGGHRGAATASLPFTNGCSLSRLSVDPFHPNVRVLALSYGGIAFSRDNGNHWMALDLTNNNRLTSKNLTQLAEAVFFDGETHGTGKPKKKLPIPGPDQHLYIALKGQSLRMVLGPFLNLESLNFTYTPKGHPASMSVQILTTPLKQTIPLYADSAGLFHGSLIFDWKTVGSIKYQYVGEGIPTPLTHPLSKSDTTSGVATASP